MPASIPEGFHDGVSPHSSVNGNASPEEEEASLALTTNLQSDNGEYDPPEYNGTDMHPAAAPASPSSDSSSPATGGGSSIPAAIFNFTNCIVGAGCIGLGGAIAQSGGFISIALIVFFAYLTKLSLDLVIRLSVQTDGADGSYENLAQVGLGSIGRLAVMACKLSYSFGCLVAYVIVIKDNCGPALKSLIYGKDNLADSRHNIYDHHHNAGIGGWVHLILTENALFTWLVTSTFILPLCLLRDMTPLAFASFVSVASMIMIVVIVIYIFFARPDVHGPPESFYEMWVEVRPGVLDSLGTFVFTFVSQHTVHLVFASLKPGLRTVKTWGIVSSFSILAATVVSLLVGVFVYMTFGAQTKSDIFQIYPQGWMIDMAKLLLCITMVFTFPLPFFTCRELLIVTVIHPLCGIDLAPGRSNSNSEHAENSLIRENSRETTTLPDTTCDYDLQLPLLEAGGQADNIVDDDIESNPTPNSPSSSGRRSGFTRRLMATTSPKNWLLPDDDRQLQLAGHVAVTVKLWIVATGLAIAAPSLGDILDLVGCASGTLIAFVFPAILSLRIEGYSNQAMCILAVGGAVGTVGTYFSVRQIVRDLSG